MQPVTGWILLTEPNLTGDGIVDIADYTVWADNYSKELPNVPASSAAVLSSVESIDSTPVQLANVALPQAAPASPAMAPSVADLVLEQAALELVLDDMPSSFVNDEPPMADIRPAVRREEQPLKVGAALPQQAALAWAAHQAATDQAFAREWNDLSFATAPNPWRFRNKRFGSA